MNYIAQNGIQVGYGATATISSNTVSGNAYSGTNNASSGGILIVGGVWLGAGVPYTTGVEISRNTLTNNDVGVYLFNADGSFNAPATATNNTVSKNTISNSFATNVSGNGSPNGYQAGISDFGNHDSLDHNKISGNGYKASFELTAGSLYTEIDTTGSVSPHLKNNK